MGAARMSWRTLAVIELASHGCEVCGAPVDEVSERFCGGDRCRGVFMPPTTATSWPASILRLTLK
jgi:hypothetical protein